MQLNAHKLSHGIRQIAAPPENVSHKADIQEIEMHHFSWNLLLEASQRVGVS